MNKKLLVGIAASISTVITGLLWVWYANIPSFDKCDQGFNELTNATFQEETINATK